MNSDSMPNSASDWAYWLLRSRVKDSCVVSNWKLRWGSSWTQWRRRSAQRADQLGGGGWWRDGCSVMILLSLASTRRQRSSDYGHAPV